MMRILRLEDETDASEVCRRVDRLVPDPNLRGWAAILGACGDDELHLLRQALQRTRVFVLTGRSGVALLGDLYALHLAARELGELGASRLSTMGRELMRATEVLDGRPPPLEIGARSFDWSRPVVMGIVNVTPDSFSDGGRYSEVEAAVRHGVSLAEEGADVLDVGGESTRPRGATYGEGAQTVPVEEEIARVVPVIRGLRERVEVPISIDTRKAAVARAALEAGATMVNDVSGLKHDPSLAKVAAERGAALCLMHTPADIESLKHEVPCADVIGEVLSGLRASLEEAVRRGVRREHLVVDPGIGFGKTYAGNLLLLRHLEAVAALGPPVLVGASRKATVGRAGAAWGEGTPLPVSERLHASVGAAVTAWLRGAHLLRVHDVRATVEALRMAAAIRGATVSD